MKLVVLHQDDYARALAGGMVPFDIDEDRSDDKIRICIDHFLSPEKGEAIVLDISPLPPLPGPRFVFHGSRILSRRACQWNGCEKDAICAEETMGSRYCQEHLRRYLNGEKSP